MGDLIRVLLVDDQSHFADLAKSFLEREEERFEVETATSAAEGLDRLASDEFDCIVSDFDMPRTDGLEFFEAVRANEIDLPFILFSGKEENDLEDRSRFGAVTAFLQKGGNESFKDLARRIKLSVSAHRADRDQLEIQERYSALFEDTGRALAWLTRNGEGPVIADYNERFREEIAASLPDPGGQPIDTVFEPFSIGAETIEDALGSGEPTTVTAQHYSESAGSHYRLRIVPIGPDESGQSEHGLVSVIDVSNRTASDHKLEVFRTIVEAAGDPMYVLDMSGRFRYVNDAMVDLTGYDRGQLLGSDGQLVMTEADYQTGTELIRSLLRSDRDSGTFEMDLLKADGTAIPTENHVALVYDEETGNGDEVKATAGVIRDVSAQNRRLEALREHNRRLEELAGFISHDLQNPITTARGYLDLVTDEVDRPEHEKITQALTRMDNLVDDLLVMTRAGQRVTDPDSLALSDLAKQAWADVETETAVLELTDDRSLQGDRSRIRRLLTNLFANAVEHGEDAVTIEVGATEDGFYVADDGPGIPPERRDEVFEYGYTTRPSGSGFGLAIVKAVAQAHRWELSLTESDDGGARFEFSGVNHANGRRRPPLSAE